VQIVLDEPFDFPVVFRLFSMIIAFNEAKLVFSCYISQFDVFFA